MDKIRSSDTGVTPGALRCRQHWLAPDLTVGTCCNTCCSQCSLMEVWHFTSTAPVPLLYNQHNQSLSEKFVRILVRIMVKIAYTYELEHVLGWHPPDSAGETT